jgi:hypothetical protein
MPQLRRALLDGLNYFFLGHGFGHTLSPIKKPPVWAAPISEILGGNSILWHSRPRLCFSNGNEGIPCLRLQVYLLNLKYRLGKLEVAQTQKLIANG